MLHPSLPNVVYVTDLGLDRLVAYEAAPGTGSLVPAVGVPPVAFPAGTGPRHMAFHPSASVLYVLGELGNTLSVSEHPNTLHPAPCPLHPARYACAPRSLVVAVHCGGV